MAELSILIAHKHEPTNDAALLVALQTIVENTGPDYELLVDTTTPAGVYATYNKLALQATAPYLVLTNTDVFFAPGWAEAFLEVADPNAIITGVIVECGAIPVAAANVEKNFGMIPQTFRRYEFEEWVAKEQPLPPGNGWYFPSLHHRAAFLQSNGFELSLGEFPTTWLDKIYWQDWILRGGEIRHVRSYSYHLQAYSDIERTAMIRERGVR
jgi:hypothetical protein